MGSIYRQENRGRKTYRARTYRDGKRIDVSTGTEIRTEAKAFLKRLEGEVAAGRPLADRTWTFEDAVALVVGDYKAKRNRSLGTVESRIRTNLAPFFGGRELATVGLAEILRYRDERVSAGAGPGTVNRELAILRRCFTLSMDIGKLVTRPSFKAAKLGEQGLKRQGFFERDEFRAVLGHLPEWLRGPIVFAYYTGWRIASEILTLEWADVDLAAGIVKLDESHSKNGKARILPFAAIPELAAVIATARAERDAAVAAGRLCPHVFTRDGGPLVTLCGSPIWQYRLAWKRATTAAGVPGKLLHDFRRSAVRNLTRAGVPESVAMKITGHETPWIFKQYDIVDPADVRAGLGQLDAYHAAS